MELQKQKAKYYKVKKGLGLITGLGEPIPLRDLFVTEIHSLKPEGTYFKNENIIYEISGFYVSDNAIYLSDKSNIEILDLVTSKKMFTIEVIYNELDDFSPVKEIKEAVIVSVNPKIKHLIFTAKQILENE